jgi:hypothetical protein
MSTERPAPSAARRAGAGVGRVHRAWNLLSPDRRLAAIAAIGLFASLFLPWYQETLLDTTSKKPIDISTSVTGWGAFSPVEAAVLLVAAGVLLLLFKRAEGNAFHVPGGDGFVVMAAGVWTCLLVIWRIFDKQSTDLHGQGATISGIEWGIFVALAVAALMAYAGNRIRAAHQPEPPLPGEPGGGEPVSSEPQPPRAPSPAATEPMPTRRRPAAPAAEGSEAPTAVAEPPATAAGRRRRARIVPPPTPDPTAPPAKAAKTARAATAPTAATTKPAAEPDTTDATDPTEPLPAIHDEQLTIPLEPDE